MVKLLWQDYLVLLGVVLLMGAHVSTNFLLAYYRDAATTAEASLAVVQAMEANPLMAYMFLLTNFSTILTYVVVPAWVIGAYVFARRFIMRVDTKQARDSLGFIAIMIFLMFAADFLNDFGFVLGILAKTGG